MTFPTTPHPTPAERPHGLTPAIEIRHVRSRREFEDCVALQHATWGADFSERVPAAILKVSQRVGGITAGAFEPDGRLAGFVFGLTGVEQGTLVHWSDMLAVCTELRDHGIGRKLKEFQRDALLRLGVARIYWTFDPLVARNAHFNLNRLGARVVEYVPDMYGSDTGSSLHQGIGSDRFVVAWEIAADGAPRPPGAGALEAIRRSPILNPVNHQGRPAIPDTTAAAAPLVLRIAIPDVIERIQADSIPDAARWRASTRAAFTWALARGYQVRSFQRDEDSLAECYVLSTTPLPTDAP